MSILGTRVSSSLLFWYFNLVFYFGCEGTDLNSDP